MKSAATQPQSAADVPWDFVIPNINSKQRDPVQAEFFRSAESIPTDCVALVRESIQNVLDQGRDPNKAVRVRFTLSGDAHALPAQVATKYFGRLWEHLDAIPDKDALSIKSVRREDPCRFLIVEDFETTGLVGDPAATKDPAPGERNDFLFFFKREGKSGKSGTDGGRWGIGKHVFPMSSQILTFFGMTIREDDKFDQGAGLLMGQATLFNHDIGKFSYEPDGTWSYKDPESSAYLPLTNPALIDEFKKDWKVTRDREPGLSIVVPYLAQSGWDHDQLAGAVIDEYFPALLSGRLVVEICDFGGRVTELNQATLPEVARQLSHVGASSRTGGDIGLLVWGLKQTPMDLGFRFEGQPTWGKVKSDADALQVARERLEECGKVVVTVPVTVDNKLKKTKRQGTMRVILMDEKGLSEPAVFVRSGIMIKEASKTRLHGIRAIVLIEDTNLVTMLGDAEGPAHTNWSADSRAFQGKYVYGSAWLTVVRGAPSGVLRHLRGGEEEQDVSVAADFFAVSNAGTKRSDRADSKGNTDNGSSGRKSTENRSSGGSESPIRISRSSDGFSVGLDTASAQHVARLTVRVAYATRAGDAFKRWSPEDFEFGSTKSPGSIRIDARGCKISCLGNQISVSAIKPSRFHLNVRGFDTKRDVAVDCEVGE